MKLSKTEEQIMELIWANGRVFMKDLTRMLPELAPSTIATFLKRMQEKGYVGYDVFGNSREYYPLVKKNDYFQKQLTGLIKDFFDGSALQFASFFTKSVEFSEEELEELKSLVDNKIKSKS